MIDTLPWEITFGAIVAQIQSLKNTLGEDQVKIYEEKMKELKDKFIKDRPNLNKQDLEKIEILFQ
ncbi:hypothetical protein [Chryseobacterium sp. Mn2064]|uniref:hypothetical protein n=1 Tax=Chryseobacterium sp. Mn2064 TaxID=3395263 RepID=UPI003BDBFB7B